VLCTVFSTLPVIEYAEGHGILFVDLGTAWTLLTPAFLTIFLTMFPLHSPVPALSGFALCVSR
jgi:hypothetical protein